MNPVDEGGGGPKYGYTGRKWDTDAELYYYRARWYDPAIGRFVSEDPIGFAGNDANVTAFISNDPVNYRDATGLKSEGVGHHWVPVSVFEDFKDQMTNAAYEGALGGYSGQTSPNHNYGALGGVRHSRYNEVVRDMLTEAIASSPSSRFTVAEMDDFIDKVKNGKNLDGLFNNESTAYNDEVRRRRDDFIVENPNSKDPPAIRREGRKAAKSQKARSEATAAQRRRERRQRGQMLASQPARVTGLALAPALTSELATAAVQDATGGLAVASESENFKDAIDALQRGDLVAANESMIGNEASGDDGLVSELVDEKIAIGGLDVWNWWENILTETQASVGWGRPAE